MTIARETREELKNHVEHLRNIAGQNADLCNVLLGRLAEIAEICATRQLGLLSGRHWARVNELASKGVLDE